MSFTVLTCSSFQPIAGDRGHRDGHVLQRLLALAGSDDDVIGADGRCGLGRIGGVLRR
ncbi:hypothetical protein NHF48_004140 [Sphingomonas sp. H160509]|uniref:hypothetical protein n=1 Tax=Sphingomonas sp. H160509 TaxID=2955313 RepID=UPI002097FE5A|nr:hypothetical protein [Sphingomonas sp. H160509]MDD1450363.1 hypothetical protein [Sphingomonas sp. H160509]